jgi:ATP-dependent Lon protease
LVIPIGINAIQTDAFLRVTRRAERHAQELGQLAVTGANALMGIFPETRSPAAHLLGEQGVSQERAADFIAHDIGKED